MKFPKHIPKLQRYDHFRLCILLQRSTDKIHELTQARNAAKLSSSRVASIGKELKELTKVLSQYCEN